ncbi:Penicillin-binding protein 1A [Candidatus Bealeia paramacronuclearis]|uniref:Penicillin-binding protein 1A n=1 Tax=Candidatus Bealeia paramacronuclearis TaxID=1921001 RepID=A0ABZ2C389_9PROT|nr:Penicillin-binding protein 1A [Candidatus Bealeia paramacronuclearis]
MLRFLGWLFTLIIMGAVAAGAIIFCALYYYGNGLPDYEQLAQYEPPVVSRLYATDGRLFAEYATQKRVFVPITSIPDRVIKTFLAAEDKNFYEHNGLDFTGIIRAAVINLVNIGSNKRPMGASTITQQVAKNLLLSSISTHASYERKIKEAILAFRIEKALSKDRILEIYLNEIFLGNSSYGVAAAALNYFNKSLEELTPAEAAFLAGLPKAPSRYSPKTNYAAAKARRDWVISRMVEEKVITTEEGKEALEEPITLRQSDPAHVVHADYFAEEVRRNLVTQYGEASLYEGGLTVRTTLDPKLQKIADQALRQGLISYDQRHGFRGPVGHLDLLDTNPENWMPKLASFIDPAGISPWQTALVLELKPTEASIGLKDGSVGKIPLANLKWARKHIPPNQVGPEIKSPKDVLQIGDIILVSLSGQAGDYKLEQVPKVSGALIALDPHSGRVLAMSGGFSFSESQFNRATQALRQPGSAIKTFVYLAAMERGFSPATIVSDSPIAISLGRGLGMYTPKNVTDHHYGPVPLRIGLQKSLNMMTIRLVHEYIGMKPVKDIIEKFGVIDNVPIQLAIALGAGETTVLKLANAYAILANGGRQVKASLIDRIQDRHGKTLYQADQRLCPNCKDQKWMGQESPLLVDTGETLADPRSIYQITSMLEGAVRAGSAQRAKEIGKILAVKTGTTNEERDAWSVGYTPNLVAAVFVGFDNPQPLGDKEGGARVALPIFVDFMKHALEGIPSIPFKMPAGMKIVRLNEMTGQPAQPGDKSVIFEALKNQNFEERQTSPEGTITSEPLEFQEEASYNHVESLRPSLPTPQPVQPDFSGTGGLY